MAEKIWNKDFLIWEINYQQPLKVEMWWKKEDGQGLAIREAKNVPHSSGTHSEKDEGEG